MAQAGSGATPNAVPSGPGNGTPHVNLQGAASTREYLNSQIAPFLKKAINQTLDANAEYPLQYLGERLIRYSMQYEGNSDTTGITGHFKYAHEEQGPQTSSRMETEAPPDINGGRVEETGAVDAGNRSTHTPLEQTMIESGTVGEQPQPQVNGHVSEQQPKMEGDTEMGGTA